MRGEWVSLVNDFWMPLVKHWDLSKDKQYNFKHTIIMPQTRPSFYMYTLYKLTVCTCLKDHNKDNDLICMNYLLLDVKQQTLKISKFPNYLRIYYFQYDGLILAFKRPENSISAIFRTKISLTRTKTFDCDWKCMESWIRNITTVWDDNPHREDGPLVRHIGTRGAALLVLALGTFSNTHYFK
jgi:hypothetical protein